MWDENDQWLLEDASGRQFRAILQPTTVVHPSVVVLNFKLPDNAWWWRKRAVVILKDSIDGDQFRRLRVRLRWYPGTEADSLGARE